jgi:predicted TIM-barrel fold metal-dependent hydrolase
MSEKYEPSRREFLSRSGVLLLGSALSDASGSDPRAATTIVAEQEGKVPVIDCHAHAGIARLSGTEDDLTDPWNAVADPEMILQHAKEAGIDQTVIFPIYNRTYEKANEEIAEICRRYPGRFIGFADHSPATEAGRIRSLLLREYHELGVRGVGEFEEEPTPELLNVVKELHIPILIHPPHERVAPFNDFVPSYPEVNFIVAHLGSSGSEDFEEHLAAINLAKRYPNVYLDTSNIVITRYLEMAIEELGPQKILFASDEPESDCRLEIFKIRNLKLPKEHEEMILGGNMLRLLGGSGRIA